MTTKESRALHQKLDAIQLELCHINPRMEAIEKRNGVLAMPTGVFLGCITIGLAVAAGLMLILRALPSSSGASP